MLQQVFQLYGTVLILKGAVVAIAQYLVAGAALSRHHHESLVVAEVNDIDVLFLYDLRLLAIGHLWGDGSQCPMGSGAFGRFDLGKPTGNLQCLLCTDIVGKQTVSCKKSNDQEGYYLFHGLLILNEKRVVFTT